MIRFRIHNNILLALIITFVSQCTFYPEVKASFGSSGFYERVRESKIICSFESFSPDEQKEFKRHMINQKIQKTYGSSWDEEKKQKILKYTYEFFKNSSILFPEYASFPLKIFSECTDFEETKYLIQYTNTLSEAVSDKESLNHILLLKTIAKLDPATRAAAYPHLLRIANSFAGCPDFYFFCKNFSALNPAQHSCMADLVIQLKKPSIESCAHDGIKILNTFKDMPLENLSLFFSFLQSNQITDFECVQFFIRVPPTAWAETLQIIKDWDVTMQEMQENFFAK